MNAKQTLLLKVLLFLLITTTFARAEVDLGIIASDGEELQFPGFDIHIDDFRQRGGTSEMPWHFHTGEGVTVDQLRSVEEGVGRKIISRCKLSKDNPDCQEKVFFFTESEILQFVNAAVFAYEKDLRTHEIGVAFSTAVVVWTGKIFITSLVAPDPTVVASKIISIGSGLVAGAMAIVAAWEGMEIVEIHATLRKIEDLLAKERRYVSRCGNISRNFLDQLKVLGIEIRFLQNGFDLIPGHYFLETLENEKKLLEQTKAYASENSIDYVTAYREFFANACGQLPLDRLRRPTRKFPWRALQP